MPRGGLGELLGLHLLQLLDGQPALRKLVAPLLASLRKLASASPQNQNTAKVENKKGQKETVKKQMVATHLLRLLVLRCRL